MWIKEPEAEWKTISGTVVMTVDKKRIVKTSMDSDLKQTTRGVVLNPQPQDDPNDPLNWPIWRRDIALGTVSIYALLAGGMTPLLAPVMGELGKLFDKPYHTMTYLVGALMVSMGVGSALLAPFAVKFGKRPAYIIALFVFIGGLFWGANADSYGSLMGARVLSGLGASAAESLPSTTIAEIYFAHERAYRLGIYTLLLLGGKNLSPLVSGFTANRLGWHWIFWLASIICAAAIVGVFFFVHETFWDRTPVPNARSQRESEAAQLAREERNLPPWQPPAELMHHRSSQSSEAPVALRRSLTLETNDTTFSTKQSSESRNNAVSENEHHGFRRTPFFSNLSLYSGPKTSAPLWKIFLRPFILYGYLPIVFATLIYGTSVVWLSVIAETINAIFTAEPYNFPTTSVGLLYVATFTGGVLGSMIAGKVSDWLVRIICQKNGGIYEPEFRLLMMLPVMLSISIGLMGFGWSTHSHDLWIVPAIFLGILGFGTSLASTVSITYVVDCYRKYALEALVSLNFAKNVLGLAFSIFVPYFFSGAGSKTSFVVYGSIEVGLCLLAIPMYHYGKVVRHWHDLHPWADKLYVHQ
nr:Hol1 [Starmerella bombicola]